MSTPSLTIRTATIHRSPGSVDSANSPIRPEAFGSSESTSAGARPVLRSSVLA
jgi:hypothetical protein